MSETETETDNRPAASRAEALRSRGMHDIGPDEMRRFRRVEARFLEVTAAGGYQEIRTPTVEPLHLFTSAGALSPQPFASSPPGGAPRRTDAASVPR